MDRQRISPEQSEWTGCESTFIPVLQGLEAFHLCGRLPKKLLKNYAKIMIRQFPRCLMLNSGCRMLDVGCWIVDAGCLMLKWSAVLVLSPGS